MNGLKVHMMESIRLLSGKGFSNRKIARILSVSRTTVNRHVSLARSNCATVSPGNLSVGGSPNCARVSPGTGKCEIHRESILKGLESGLTCRRIYQDLVLEHDFSGSYRSVARFARRLGQFAELPFRRMEVEPGTEMQVDFGNGAPVLENGKKRKTHLFRTVLSCCRKGCSESVFQQTTENFIRVLENSFRHLGGVPASVVIDNLKAGVLRADWYDPELNPKLAEFCRHYGTVILPTRPGIPRHKGKIENGVGYVKSNALKGRVFSSLAEQNKYLLDWETNVADKRIHGTTREQVAAAFEREKPFLKALPPDLFPCFEEGKRTVHRDGHVEVRKAYYSVPPEYTGSEVWVRWDGRMVRIFDRKGQQIAVHVMNVPGKFNTAPEHIPARKKSMIENGPEWLLRRAAAIGPYSEAWARTMYANRGEIGMRVMLGLLSMTKKHRSQDIETACRKALDAGGFSIRDVKSFMAQDYEQGTFEFLDEHPLIRKMDFYGEIVKQKEKGDECCTADGHAEAQAFRDGTDN